MDRSSPDEQSHSEDDLPGTVRARYETVETVPLIRGRRGDGGEGGQETLATLPINPYTQQSQPARLTQPTQLVDRYPAPVVSSPPPFRATVQVSASSPIQTPLPTRKPSGVLSTTLMAPRGTYLQRPFAIPPPRPQPINIDSDDDGPKYKGDSSDEEQGPSRASDIKQTNFQRKIADSDTVPESPARGNGLFKSIIDSASYDGSSHGVKRSADPMATAYGNPYKKPRQTGPSRALPVTSPATTEPDMELDDISDPNLRKKLRRMTAVVTKCTMRQCYDALMANHGNCEDAISYALEMSEREQKSSNRHIDLTGSDDELMPTPAGQKKAVPIAARPSVAVKQQAKVPQKSITEKWSSTQQPRKDTQKKFDVFSPPKKSRTLVRGRKERSSPPAEGQQSDAHIGKPVVVEDDSDEDDSGILSAPEDATFEDRLLKFFNECTAADLVDTAVIKPEYAEHILTRRPFKTLSAVEKIEAPDLKPTKQKRKAVTTMGDRVLIKVSEMLVSYEAVDYLVQKCEDLAKPLTAEIKSWGIKPNKPDSGELDMVSLRDSQGSGHDSGIGTPVSDDEIKINGPKKLLSQPSIMSSEFKMKDYQVVGMNWLNLLYKKRMSCILADDMGLGKTYQVIAFLAHLLETGDPGPHLVVVPSATLENWLQEFHRFCPALVVEPYYSTQPGERAEIRLRLEDDRDNINVIVTTYQLAKGKEDFPWLKGFGFRCTVFDEGHVLKNADSIVSRKLNRIKCRTRLLLTGTPLQNNLRELISLLAFMMPELFQERQEALKAIFTHNVKALDENHEALLSAQRITRARSMLTPFILRRKKYQVLKDLPKKDRRVEWCDLTPEQSEIYSSWLQKAMDIRERRERGEETLNESTAILMKLRQAAIHPFLFRRFYTDDQLPKIAKQCLKAEQWSQSNPDLIVTELLAYSDMELHTLCNDNKPLVKFALHNREWLASGKVQKMLELLRTYMSEGSKILIFSQFVMVLDILELVLGHEDIPYFRLDGSTRVSERQDLIDEFSHKKNTTPVFMLSTKAGGAGINLASANKVIVFDSGFNPQDDIQAENRAHRIGQVKDVEVVRLITRGTVEEQIYKMGLTKLKLDEEVAGFGESEVDLDNAEQSKGKAAAAPETEKETEGRKMVEEMFFKKLEENPQQTIAEAKSPVRQRSSQTAIDAPSGSPEDTDSQKTLKPDPEDEDEDESASTTSAEVKRKTRSRADKTVKEEAGGDADADLPNRPKRGAAGGAQTRV